MSLTPRHTTRLRQLLRRPGSTLVPGAPAPLVARMIEEAGFEAAYLSGAGAAATLLGLPDTGLISVTEMVANAANTAAAIDIPLIADADTGYGNPLNVFRTVRSFEQAGVAAVHVEDQVWPKKCGHLEGKRLIAREEMVQKIRAACDARRDPDFVIIARCDALGVTGLEDALDRGRAYAEAGADVLFIEAPRSLEDLKAISRSFSVPLMLNIAASEKTPMLGIQEIGALDFKLAIYPNFALLAGIKAMGEVLRDLHRTGDVKTILDRTVSFREFMRLAGLERIQQQEERYGVPADARSRVNE